MKPACYCCQERAHGNALTGAMLLERAALVLIGLTLPAVRPDNDGNATGGNATLATAATPSYPDHVYGHPVGSPLLGLGTCNVTSHGGYLDTTCPIARYESRIITLQNEVTALRSSLQEVLDHLGLLPPSAPPPPAPPASPSSVGEITADMCEQPTGPRINGLTLKWIRSPPTGYERNRPHCQSVCTSLGMTCRKEGIFTITQQSNCGFSRCAASATENPSSAALNSQCSSCTPNTATNDYCYPGLQMGSQRYYKNTEFLYSGSYGLSYGCTFIPHSFIETIVCPCEE